MPRKKQQSVLSRKEQLAKLIPLLPPIKKGKKPAHWDHYYLLGLFGYSIHPWNSLDHKRFIEDMTGEKYKGSPELHIVYQETKRIIYELLKVKPAGKNTVAIGELKWIEANAPIYQTAIDGKVIHKTDLVKKAAAKEAAASKRRITNRDNVRHETQRKKVRLESTTKLEKVQPHEENNTDAFKIYDMLNARCKTVETILKRAQSRYGFDDTKTRALLNKLRREGFIKVVS